MRRANGSTPRTESRALRGKCSGRAATGYVPRTKSQVLRAKWEGQETVGSHPAEIGFETHCVTPIESRGQGFAVALGRGTAGITGAVFSSPFVSPVSTVLFQRLQVKRYLSEKISKYPKKTVETEKRSFGRRQL